MKILSINFCNQKLVNIKNKNSDKKIVQNNSGRCSEINNSVTFRHTAENAEPLRSLIKLGMVDIYTGKFVIDPEYFERILQQKVFNCPLAMIVKVIEPIKNSLHKVPLEIFEMLAAYSKKNPDVHLDAVFKKWAPEAQDYLYKSKQKPIFSKLEYYSTELPPEEKAAFAKLIHEAKEQIHQRSIPKEFNKRDFRYKLVRISQRIKQSNFSEEVSAINRLINMSKQLPDDEQKTLFKRHGTKKNQKQIKKRLDIVQRMRNYYENSVLNDDAELSQLFLEVKSQLYEIPVFIPFSRKNFIEDLKKITEHIENKDLAKKMLQLAAQLPTAVQEKSAFIVKSSRKSSEKIGFDMLIGSVGNIDHIKARVDGGKDAVSNYAVSTNFTNSERSNRSIEKQFRLHPEAYIGCQKYVDRLIYFANNGILRKVGLTKNYVSNFAKRMEKLVPDLKLDISDLK